MKTSIKPNIFSGIIIFIAVLLMLIYVASPMQLHFGILGFIFTEVILLFCGLIPIFFYRLKLQDVLPFKRTSLRQILGTLFLWFGSYIVILLVSLILFYFFPNGMSSTNHSIVNFYSNLSYPLAVVVIAVLPAICEEVLHRGFIQYTFHKVKNKWIVILSIGIIFGIFHLDPYRFLPTTILGIVLAYIMVETNNILLPMIFHFVNNAVTVSSSINYTETPEQVTTVSLFGIGAYLIFSTIAPLLIIIGSKLLHSKEQIALSRKSKKTRRMGIIGTLIAMSLFASGISLTVASYPAFITMSGETILNTSWSKTINKDTTMDTLPNIVILDEDSYKFDFIATGGNANCTVGAILKNSDGQIVFETGYGGEFSINSFLTLKADTYTIEYHYENTLQESILMNITNSIVRH